MNEKLYYDNYREDLFKSDFELFYQYRDLVDAGNEVDEFQQAMVNGATERLNIYNRYLTRFGQSIWEYDPGASNHADVPTVTGTDNSTIVVNANLIKKNGQLLAVVPDYELRRATLSVDKLKWDFLKALPDGVSINIGNKRLSPNAGTADSAPKKQDIQSWWESYRPSAKSNTGLEAEVHMLHRDEPFVTGMAESIKKEKKEKSNTPVEAPPSDYNDAQKVQYYLSKLGFNIGVDANSKPIVDGNLGVMSASSIILFQQKMGLPITGLADNATLAVLADCAEKGISYDDIMKKEGKELAAIPQSENGCLTATSFTKIPAIGGTVACLPEKAAVAWANLVQAAAQDPNNNMSVFYLAGPVSGYRSFEAQVDLKDYWTRQGLPGNAATPGYSDHGWGRAIDINVVDPQRGIAQSYELKWLEENAKRFGFEPLLNEEETRIRKVNYYKETWHWIYTG